MTRPARPSIAGELLRRWLAASVDAGRFPGATWWVGEDGRALSRGAVGRTSTGPEHVAVTETTPYDLASLTKPLSTALLLVLLEQEGRLDLASPLDEHLAATRGSPFGSRDLLSLATHTAGFVGWRPLFVHGSSLDEYVAEIVRTPQAMPCGETLYSDLGYILLGRVIEEVSGTGLARLFAERIATPLGLERIGYPAPERQFRDAAETEIGNGYERSLAGAEGATHAWRERIPAGEVHDANAHGLGGIAGHAGLFGTAAEVARIATEILRPERLPLGDRARRRLLEVVSPSDGRTVGFVIASRSSAARGILPGAAPGHTGFTGTSLWIDPATERCFVLLTNRVHPQVSERGFQSVRRAFHRLALRSGAVAD